MVNFRIIARVISLALVIEGLFMLVSAAVSFFLTEPAATSLLFSGILTLVAGILVFSPLRNEEKVSGYKEGYIITVGIWLILSLFGTLPYLFTGSVKNFCDAFFESVSGFTTTGATIITDLDALPKGLILWRNLTQWLGGIGFILISLSVLPVLRAVNIQLTITDFTGQSTDKLNPRTSETFKMLVTVYLILTLAETLLLVIGGVNVFDALCISLSTLSTGGFSPENNSLAGFGSPYVLLVITIFMFLAGVNLTLVYFGYKQNFKKISGNSEFIFYSVIVLVFLILMSLILWLKDIFPPVQSLIQGAFQTISIITTTGFYNADYNLWGGFLILIIFLLMFTGGTSGSASGSLNMIRVLLAAKNTRHEMKRIIHPNAVIPVRLDGKIVPQTLIYNLLVFITLYFVIICISAIVLSFMGYDLITSFSTSASILGNIGPGPGSFGPFSTFASLPSGGKWFLAFLMLLGRLEILSVLVLFTRSFYKR
ncbi:MAG TPA: TrkH family potassium uptake protein [Bacteroidales bacterium]|nr:TrkH family potassium uptake protein [Bacteroidales bacterium]HOX75278.1 TrkH family potassium uptake protein [Bacteroidales bacterium]HPM88108.1 TrkH family potassium uptake protein [Bacteroidales bacterium]